MNACASTRDGNTCVAARIALGDGPSPAALPIHNLGTAPRRRARSLTTAFPPASTNCSSKPRDHGWDLSIDRMTVSGMPHRRNRADTIAASRLGRLRTSRAGITIGRSVAELRRRSSGCRSTTSRLTYQSPSAVSDAADGTADSGRRALSFRVRRRTTIRCVEAAWSQERCRQCDSCCRP